jgi:hypothetical protein
VAQFEFGVRRPFRRAWGEPNGDLRLLALLAPCTPVASRWQRADDGNLLGLGAIGTRRAGIVAQTVRRPVGGEAAISEPAAFDHSSEFSTGPPV